MKFSGKRTLVVYDSSYGNTAKIANIIARTLKAEGPVTIKHVRSVAKSDIEGVSLLVLGSPTQGGRATQAMSDFIDSLSQREMKNIRAAVFDTRFAVQEHGLGLKLLMKSIGFAATKMAKMISDRGGTMVIQPEGFIVENKDGPLKNGELVRAVGWAKLLLPPKQTVV